MKRNLSDSDSDDDGFLDAAFNMVQSKKLSSPAPKPKPRQTATMDSDTDTADERSPAQPTLPAKVRATATTADDSDTDDEVLVTATSANTPSATAPTATAADDSETDDELISPKPAAPTPAAPAPADDSETDDEIVAPKPAAPTPAAPTPAAPQSDSETDDELLPPPPAPPAPQSEDSDADDDLSKFLPKAKAAPKAAPKSAPKPAPPPPDDSETDDEILPLTTKTTTSVAPPPAGLDSDSDDEMAKWLPNPTTSNDHHLSPPSSPKAASFSSLTASSLANLKVPELKALLKSRSLPVSGKKDDLISRLLNAENPPTPPPTTGNALLDDMAQKRAAKSSKPAAKRAKKTVDVIDLLSSDEDVMEVDAPPPPPAPVHESLPPLLEAIRGTFEEMASVPLTRTVSDPKKKKDPTPDNRVSAVLLPNLDGKNGTVVAEVLKAVFEPHLIPAAASQYAAPGLVSGTSNTNDVYLTASPVPATGDYLLLEASKALEPVLALVCGLYATQPVGDDEEDEDACSFACPKRFLARADKVDSVALTTQFTAFPSPDASGIKPKWGADPESSAEGGRQHPHTKHHAQTTLVINLGRKRTVLVDCGAKCKNKLTGTCWCTRGKHWMTAEVMPKFGEERVQGEKLKCKDGDCATDKTHVGRCQECQVVEMKSGDALLFDGREGAKVVTATAEVGGKLEGEGGEEGGVIGEMYKGCAVQVEIKVLEYGKFFEALEKEVRVKLREMAYYGSGAAYWHQGYGGDAESEDVGDGIAVRPFLAISKHFALKIDDWDELEHWNKEDAKADGFKANAYKSDQLAKARGEAGMAIDAIVAAAREKEGGGATLTRAPGSLWNFLHYVSFRTGRDSAGDGTVREFTESVVEELTKGEQVRGEMMFDGRVLDGKGEEINEEEGRGEGKD